MKKYWLLLFLLLTQFQAIGQIKFLSRFEIKGQAYDPPFETMRTASGLVSFRTLSTKSFSGERVFQFFVSDRNLNSKGIVELTLRLNFDMIGYDIDGDRLYVLLAKGSTSNANKYILEVDLQTNQGLEYPADNLLPLDLVEFLVQDKKAVFLGMADSRPVLQILDLVSKSLHTVQGIYSNNTQVMQIRKMPDLESLEVVVSRKGQYRNRELLILTFDLLGNLYREVKVDQFGDPGQEILDGLLLADQNYQQVMIGSYGLNSRGNYQGMFIMEINEFGEFDFKLYDLGDFPNFYNYLKERQKAKKDQQVLKDLEKGKIPAIRNTYTVRDVRETENAYLVYFDQVNIVTSRGGNRASTTGPFSEFRYDQSNRMAGPPPSMLNQASMGNMMPIYSQTEYQYISSHFIKVSKEGRVIWENSATYGDFATFYPEPFGEIALQGEDLYHVYAEDDQIVTSFFRNGEKKFDRLYFGIELPTENERIRRTDLESLRLVHWYDQYFLLSGMQSIRYQNEEGLEEVKEVFFLSKFVIDGDLYQPEEKGD
ncbi:hypothetical protein [Algoriphagus confluentis]|uniref:Uncharacterized protein n=1 Tax=Algoriphagus confluentis TaxID=1697556 RepID=A0ABQ6PSW4_9BACT|nr:hypothetical protein Aconfl_34560 [Algoriphagus confluentis]